jgi:hypothetical protein
MYAVMPLSTHHLHVIRSGALGHCECNAGIGAYFFTATNQG